MNDLFDLPVSYNEKDLLFPTRLLQLGYTHKFQVNIYGLEVLFEPVPTYDHEQMMTGYADFVAQTLKSYSADVSVPADFANRDTLLQRCIRAMRQELSAEADRLYAAFSTEIGEELAFKHSLRQMAESAVFQLQEIIHCPVTLVA